VVDRTGDRTANKEPLTDDAVPVTRLSHDPGQSTGQGLGIGNISFSPEGDNHSEQHRSIRLGRLLGRWGQVLICLLRVQRTDHNNVFDEISNE
jgi:hypothetical protein